MKTLFLVRHAKSSRDDPSLPDRDRPLDDRGRQDAPKMGKRLATRDAKSDLLLSSPALRALTTAQLIAEEIGYKRKDIVVDDRLYASSADDLLAVIRALDKKLNRVMLFGHKPEFTDLAHWLLAGVNYLGSYARMVDSRRESNGKNKGVGNAKCGNKHLAWAFIEAAHFAVRFDATIKRWYQKKCASSLSVVAIKAVAHKLARACYHVIKDGTPFDTAKAFG